MDVTDSNNDSGSPKETRPVSALDSVLAVLIIAAIAAMLMANETTRPRHTVDGTTVSWAAVFDTSSLDRASP